VTAGHSIVFFGFATVLITTIKLGLLFNASAKYCLCEDTPFHRLALAVTVLLAPGTSALLGHHGKTQWKGKIYWWNQSWRSPYSQAQGGSA
jgi:hypothetical protein